MACSYACNVGSPLFVTKVCAIRIITHLVVTGPSITWLQGPQSHGYRTLNHMVTGSSITWLQGPQSGGYRVLNHVVTGPSITWLQGPQSRGYRALNCKVYSKAAHMCVYRVLYLEREGHSK